jgi:hypothetical protein
LTEAEQAEIAIPEVLSQTFLRTMDSCDRSAYLYLKHNGGPGAHELNRGSIVHMAIERLTRWLIDQHDGLIDVENPSPDWMPDAEEREGQAMHRVPPEVGKEVLAEVMLEHPELQVPAQERDACRYMVDHFCRGTWFDKPILGVEKTLTLEVGGFRVLARADLIEEGPPGVCEITDYKTEFPPDAEAFTEQAFDAEGRPRWAGNFQLNMLAVLAAFGTTDDGLPLGSFDRYRLHLAYPRKLRPEGIPRRTVEVDAVQVATFLEDLELQLRRLRDVNLGQRKWQATPGNHCRYCTCEYECPLPRLLRPESQHASLDSVEDLEKAGAAWYFMGRRGTNLKARIKAAARRLREADPEALALPSGDEGVYIGKDLALVFVESEKEEIKDKGALREAIDATRYGEEIDPAEHFKYRDSVTFDKRRVPPQDRLQPTNPPEKGSTQ